MIGLVLVAKEYRMKVISYRWSIDLRKIGKLNRKTLGMSFHLFCPEHAQMNPNFLEMVVKSAMA